jgi:hypothetical protein
MDTDTQLQRKTRELHSLGNQVQRYWKKLAQEAIKIAQDRGINSTVIDVSKIEHTVFLDPQNNAILYRDGESIDADALLELAKPYFPSLFRRYISGKERYETGIRELEHLTK